MIMFQQVSLVRPRSGSQSRTSEAKHDTGTTIFLPLDISKKASGSSLSESIVFTEEGVTVRVSGNVKNPILEDPLSGKNLAPGITLDFKIKISDKGEMCLTGTHDGFPAYEIYVYREGKEPKLLYGHNPQITGEGVFSLYPPAEHQVRRCK